MATTFKDINLNKFLWNALDDLGIHEPTPIQEESFSPISSGRDVVGIAQTGTGKTYGYVLPILKGLSFSRQEHPRVLIIVPTRELVIQVVTAIENVTTYMSVRTLGVYGGTNINPQKQAIAQGQDIIVATPGRLYDLAVSRVLQLKGIKKVVIDEVDVLLDFGFRPQLINIMDVLPERRQHILFSATMTTEVDQLITTFFKNPIRITVAKSGTPLAQITQHSYKIPNFYTKINFLIQQLTNTGETPDATTGYSKTLVFVRDKRMADRVFEHLDEAFPGNCAVIHSNKTQNFRLRSINDFAEGQIRILITTDVMARGIDIDDISHVINVNTPEYPENYIHRMGRTARAGRSGVSLLLVAPYEESHFNAIEAYIDSNIPVQKLPEDVSLATQLLDEERPQQKEINNPGKRKTNDDIPGPAFQEKKEKNKKVNLGGSYKREIKKKYKKPKTKGDKNYNRKNKRR